MGGLLALGEDLELVALGGRDPGALPAGVGYVDEPPHPPSNLGWTLIGLPRAAARARVSVIHAPSYTAPFWAGAPVVLTIHDVSYELHPEWYPYRRDWLRRAFYRRSARSAARILTVSAFSASEICDAYGIAPEKVTVTPLGVDPGFSPVDPEMACELPAGVTTPFLLHVGDLHERRNLAMLLDALLEARRHFGATSAVSLVLVGSDRGVGDALCRIAREAEAPEAVVLLSDVGEDRLRALYRCATALVYPSMYEGFGLPLIEAMASGTPVIASSAASIPEVVGDAALILDPADAAGWTSAMLRVLNDEELRSRMRAAGVKRASQFTWRRTAELTLDVYRRAA